MPDAGATVSGLTATRIGQDEGFSGCSLYRLDLRFDGPAGTMPQSLVAKFSPAAPEAALQLAPSNRRETAFYARNGDGTCLPVPRCHFAGFDPDSGASLVVMEDFGHCRAVSFAAGLGAADAARAVDALAAVHAHWWRHPDLDADKSLTLQAEFPMATLWPAYLGRVVSLLPDIALPTAFLALGDHLAANAEQVLSRLYHASPLTRIHRDVQADNLRFDDAGGRVIILDWQMTGQGIGTSDLGYLMISSVNPALRRQQERAMIQRYHAALTRRGVAGYDAARCHADYLRAVAGKLLITVAATVLFDNDSDAKRRWRRIDLQRLLAFCADHDVSARTFD